MVDIDNKIPDINTYLYFTVWTVIYAVIVYNVGSSDPNDTSASKQSFIWGIAYFCVLMLGMYYGNVAITQKTCQVPQIKTAILVTVVPWVLVFMVMALMLMVFPGWLTPFSNTIGYLFAKLSGVDDVLKRILAEKYDNPSIKDTDPAIVSTINQIYSNKSLLVNQITEDNFLGFWNKMKDAGLFKEMGDDEKSLQSKLYQIVRLKNIIAKLCWALLTGGFTTSISKSYISDVECKLSVEEMEERRNKFNEQNANIQAENKRVMSNSG